MSKIIRGLQDAVAYAKGDKAKGSVTLFIPRRCRSCGKSFLVKEGSHSKTCPKCEGK
jgi:predicted Zn-ribbon and HTH transcriptional regulator